MGERLTDDQLSKLPRSSHIVRMEDGVTRLAVPEDQLLALADELLAYRRARAQVLALQEHERDEWRRVGAREHRLMLMAYGEVLDLMPASSEEVHTDG